MSPWYAALSAHRWPTLLLHRRRLAPASRACCSKCSGAAPALLWQASLRPSYQLPCCPAPLRGPACRSAPRALSDASNTAPPRRVPGRCQEACVRVIHCNLYLYSMYVYTNTVLNSNSPHTKHRQSEVEFNCVCTSMRAVPKRRWHGTMLYGTWHGKAWALADTAVRT